MNNTMPSNIKIQHALEFASKGIRVIPLKPNSKEPQIIDWPSKATADQNQIRGWFEKCPDCNYGLLMGEGFAVLDIDKKKGKDGFKSLELIAEDKTVGSTLFVFTPTGGAHLYLRCPVGLPTRHGFKDGLDFQAKNSYVVGPGSAIDGAEYVLVEPARPILTIPQWLIDITSRKPQRSASSGQLVSDANKSFKAEEHGELGHLLEVIDPDLEYTEWVQVLFAGFNVFGSSDNTVSTLWHWSSSGEKYDEDTFCKAIKSHNPEHCQQVGLPRLKEIARLYPRSDSWLPFHDEAIDLEQRVLAASIEMLKQHGNMPSEQHLEGIKAIVQAMTHGLYEEGRKFRKAFPLETGMGKTTCVIALVKELQQTSKSLLISAERIEQLIEMRDQMIGAGVDPSKLGIFHSSESKYPGCPSVKPADLDRIQFLLASHNRVKADSQRAITERLMLYGKNTRNLVIWDETLLTTRAHSLERSAVRKAVSDWLIDYEEKIKRGKHSVSHPGLYIEFRNFLQEVQTRLASEDFDDDSILKFPSLECDPREYDKIINALSGKNSQDGAILQSLVAYSLGGNIRIVDAGSDHVLVQFFQTVDDACDKMVILDASARIRDLLSYDPTISVYPLRVSKDYSAVSINYLDARSSKSVFGEVSTHLESYLGELDYLLHKVIPTDEPLLICCLQALKDQIQQWATDKHPLRTIELLHWGEHRSSNRYSHIKYMATVGVLYRDRKEIAASIIGQTRNLNYPLLDADIVQTMTSEQADLLYQGISRGNSRRTFNGKAGEQHIYLFHPERDIKKMMPLLSDAMPHAQWIEYRAQILKKPVRQNAEEYMDLGNSIVDLLMKAPPATSKISLRAIHKELAPQLRSNSSTWRNAINHVQNLIVGWQRKDGSFIRVGLS